MKKLIFDFSPFWQKKYIFEKEEQNGLAFAFFKKTFVVFSDKSYNKHAKFKLMFSKDKQLKENKHISCICYNSKTHIFYILEKTTFPYFFSVNFDKYFDVV